MGKLAVGLGRTRRQDEVAKRTCAFNRRKPQGRLADSGRPFEHERREALLGTREESVERSQLYVPADDLGRHVPRDES